MSEDPVLHEDAADLVSMLARLPRMEDVFVRVRGRCLVIGIEGLDAKPRTLWRAKSLLGGFYELQTAAGRGKFVKLVDCTRIEEVADAIERSWRTYLKTGRLV